MVEKEVYQIAPLLFGSIGYWVVLSQYPMLINPSSPFEKSSEINRINLNNQGHLLTISIPVKGGRNTKLPINELAIADQQSWKKDFIRTLETNYSNAPYFDYFGQDIIDFIQNTEENYLGDFNAKSINFIHQLIPELKENNFSTENTNKTLRIKILHQWEFQIPSYYNSPKEFNLNNLSILDLLLNDAHHLINILKGSEVILD